AGIPADREDATREVARSGNVSIRLDGRCPVPCADTDADRTVAACDDIALAPYRHGGRALVEARLAAVRVVGEIAHREDSRGQVALGREVANRLNRNRIAEGDDRRRPIVSGRDVTLGGDVTALGEGKGRQIGRASCRERGGAPGRA